MNTRHCEICGETSSLEALEVEARWFWLCAPHLAQALQRSPLSLAALERVFLEPDGRRTLLARRAEDERRVFPPRPEGRRHDAGRRASDGAQRAAGPSAASRSNR